MTLVLKVAMSDDTMKLLGRKALESDDQEFRSHVQLLLGRYARAEREHLAELEQEERKVKAVAS